MSSLQRKREPGTEERKTNFTVELVPFFFGRLHRLRLKRTAQLARPIAKVIEPRPQVVQIGADLPVRIVGVLD